MSKILYGSLVLIGLLLPLCPAWSQSAEIQRVFGNDCTGAPNEFQVNCTGCTFSYWRITGDYKVDYDLGDGILGVHWKSTGPASVTAVYHIYGAGDSEIPYFVNITNALTPSVNLRMVSAPPIIYSNTTIQFQATPTNGGSAPYYNWYINNVKKSFGESDTFLWSSWTNNDVVTVEVLTDLNCVTSYNGVSDPISIHVTSLPVIKGPSNVTASQFTANWEPYAGASSYVLEVSPSSNLSIIQTFSGLTETNFRVTGLTPSTGYDYRIRAIVNGVPTINSTYAGVVTAPAILHHVKIKGNFSPKVNDTEIYTARFENEDGSLYPYLVSGVGVFFLESANLGEALSNDDHTITIQWNALGRAHIEYNFSLSSSGASLFDEAYFDVVVGNTPPAPLALSPDIITTTAFNVRWETATGADSYTVNVSNSTGNVIATYPGIGASQTSYMVDGLSPGTDYSYVIYANKGPNSSPPSGRLHVRTISPTPTALAVSTIDITASSFIAKWTLSAGANSYLLYIAVGPDYTSYVQGYDPMTITPGNVLAKLITGLNPATSLRYWLKAKHAFGTSGESNKIDVITDIPSIPSPATLMATEITSTSFRANWAPPEGYDGITHYTLEVSENDSFTPNLQSYNNAVVYDNSAVVTGLKPGTFYFYRVRAFVNLYSSNPATPEGVLTISSPPIPKPATFITSSSFTASWLPVLAATSYEVDVSTNADFSSIRNTYTGITGLTFKVEGLTGRTTYYYRLRSVNPSGKSPSSTGMKAVNLDHNYIRAVDVQVPGKTTLSAIENIDDTQKITNYSYVDGLGRPEQTVIKKGSPTAQDIVQPVTYDQFGREVKKFLPYTSETTGNFKEDALWDRTSAGDEQTRYRTGKQYGFYQTGGVVASDQYPFAETKVELSPLNRVLKQGAPGLAWQPNDDLQNMNDHSTKKKYELNTSQEVLLFNYDITTGLVSLSTEVNQRYYLVNQLYANKILDESSNEVIEYTDKEGRTICKKVQVSTVSGVKQYASTYYIYDDFGNLVVVLPPEAVTKFN
jgi:hypothetical protein